MPNDFMQFKTEIIPIVLAYIIVWTLLWLYKVFLVLSLAMVLQEKSFIQTALFSWDKGA